jgi:predicted RNase H-like nuclease
MPRDRVAVLGIDAAWTDHEPSGVALIERVDSRWICRRVSPSYEAFVGTASPSPAADVGSVLAASRSLSDGVDLCTVAVDMPLARSVIAARRTADDAVSRSFGHCWTSTHTPNARRPGPTGRRLMTAFETAGFPLVTEKAGSMPALIEVYPHVALLGLLNVAKRVPYKVSRSRRYWPDATPAERKLLIVEQWRAIIDRLSKEIDGIDLPVPEAPETAKGSQMKATEDTLDALICAWVGVRFLSDDAVPLGSEDCAIWAPHSAMSFARSLDGP